jgi:hypothetical protein
MWCLQALLESYGPRCPKVRNGWKADTLGHQIRLKRTYIITTRRITSGDELKQRNGLRGFARDLRLIAAGSQQADRGAHCSDSALQGN